MNKVLKAVAIGAGLFFGGILIGKVTGYLNYYTIPVKSNFPTLQVGDLIMASSLSKPAHGKFLVFKMVVPETGKQEACIFRIMGMPGDVLEIRSGDVYVSGRRANDTAYAMQNYILHMDLAAALLNEKIISQDQINDSYVKDSNRVAMTESMFNALGREGSRYVYPDVPDLEEFKRVWNRDWSVDHFGPVKIPAGKYFVMGDNRYWAFDSRFYGYVDEKDVMGCLLGDY